MADPSWTERQDRLQKFLSSHQAGEASYRLDLRTCTLYWVDQQGATLAAADCRVLCTYALSNRSVLMSWCNTSLPGNSNIEAIEGYPEYFQDQGPEEVWELACSLASAVEAEAVYRAMSPQSWIMLGLWRLRRGEDEAFVAGSPVAFVMKVLNLLSKHPNLPEQKVLLDNYAEALLQMACFSHAGGDFEEPLRTTSRELRNLLPLLENGPKESFGTQLQELAKSWKNRESVE